MPVDFRWDDDEKTIMRYVAEGLWNWNEFHKHLRRSTLRFDEVDHPVETIIDLRGSLKMPAGAVGHLRSLGTKTHANTGARTIILGVDEALQRALGAVDGVYRDNERLIHFAGSDEEAYAIIRAWRSV